MSRIYLLVGAFVFTVTAADSAWTNTPPQAWTEDDARQILTNSPWAKIINASLTPLQTEDQRREGGKMGQDHGVGFDGFADGRPRVQAPHSLLDVAKPESAAVTPHPSVALQLRWESALPIRVAELKSRSMEAPAFEGDGYILAVYGIPRARVDPKSLPDTLKKQAVLKRGNKKDVRPSSVEVIQRDDGTVVLYLFPLSAEISRADRRLEFDAQIGRVSIAQSFDLEGMFFEGKLEL